jgi:hypothetical protein
MFIVDTAVTWAASAGGVAACRPSFEASSAMLGRRSTARMGRRVDGFT